MLEAMKKRIGYLLFGILLFSSVSCSTWNTDFEYSDYDNRNAPMVEVISDYVIANHLSVRVKDETNHHAIENALIKVGEKNKLLGITDANGVYEDIWEVYWGESSLKKKASPDTLTIKLTLSHWIYQDTTIQVDVDANVAKSYEVEVVMKKKEKADLLKEFPDLLE